jgi:redox-regulated HSP33 family molecular chaperone
MAPLTQSHYQIATTDVVEAMEAYFDRAQQTWTRIALDATGSGVLIQALPNADIADLATIAKPELLGQCRGAAASGRLQPLNEVVIFYECRCDDDLILDMLSSLPPAQREEIWGRERAIQIECPRCGRQYRIRRNDAS